MDAIVVIGTGLAGYGVAREFRKLEQTSPLLIITSDDGRAYSKPMLSTALTKNKAAAELASADADTMAKQLNAEIRTHTRVSAIDSEAHTLQIENETVSYSKLVLALGADPFRPPLEGDSDQVLSVNDLNDYRRFRQALEHKNHVAILGGGLIGCEFANDLANSGHQVDLIDRNTLPLGSLLPKIVSEKLLAALQQLGVRWHGGTTATRVSKRDTHFELELEDGKQINADVVLSAIGLRARTTLASDAGLKVNRGIVVDRYLQTSVQDIYALGDCAEVEGHLLPYINPLMRGTRALAQTLADNPTPVTYPAMPVTLKTPAYPISVLPPPPGIEGEWQIEDEEDVLRARFIDRSKTLRGFVLCNKATSEAGRHATEVPALLN